MSLPFSKKEGVACRQILDRRTETEKEGMLREENKKKRRKETDKKWYEEQKKGSVVRDEEKQKQYLADFRKRHKSMSGFEMVLDKLQMPVKGGRLQREIGYKAIAFPTRHLASLLMWLKSPEFMCWFF